MNYVSIKKTDVANGPGIRVSLFVSGCSHHCKGCFNPETWDFNAGTLFTTKTIEEILDYCSPDYIQGLTLLGGDPFEPENQQGLLPLVREFKKRFPDKDIWAFTGYLFEDILNNMCKKNTYSKEFISYVDVLVDGPFIESLKDLRLKFKGSSNQRTIDVNASLLNNTIILLK